jgi:L-2-hydroxyglutarate oxidase LhgO
LREEIPFEMCGKVIVAAEESERPRLRAILERGRENGVDCEIITAERLRELEPACAGIEAIHVRDAGIVDFRSVTFRLAERVAVAGGEVRTSARVVGLRRDGSGFTLEATSGDVRSGIVVNCAGLQSDRVAALTGQTPDVQIVPFRGEYLQLRTEARDFCRNLIYPVPNPEFPFLGAHFTRMIDGRVECGPTAVTAFAREGYRLGIVNWSDVIEILRFPGFRRLAARHWKTGLLEMAHSVSIAVYVRTLRRLVPGIEARHLTRAPAGVRAQAVRVDGALVDDFLILESPRVINVCNAPSPAATSSLNIGALIADKIAAHF